MFVIKKKRNKPAWNVNFDFDFPSREEALDFTENYLLTWIRSVPTATGIYLVKDAEGRLDVAKIADGKLELANTEFMVITKWIRLK